MIQLTKHKLILTFVVCLFCGATKTLACDCPLLTTEQAIKQSKAVFSGEVIGFEYRKDIPNWSMDEQAKRTGKAIDYETLVVKVHVKQWWKGEVPTEIYLLTDSTRNADGTSMHSSCDYTFHRGETYLIFATGKENDYRTSNCQRTRKLTEAKDNLKILGEGMEPLENKDEPNKSMDVRAKERLSQKLVYRKPRKT
ncbi:MAG: hypothetical protein LC768_16530 [Acidobacteria bacterium]|nr:hypothetical protein [Acidobacteriota bacterium]MCA1639906.1 hypothetical protein [Acidobacteriota bacterium]